MIQFANPAFLWGFLGLAIPLGIHLLNRKEGKLIRVGSLRHIRETSTRQFRSIKLNEVFLLILRCLLISWVVLLLSGATLSGLSGNAKWLLIEPGMQHMPGLVSTIDSLQRDGYDIRFLSKEFPSITVESPGLADDYAELVKEFVSKKSGRVLVLSFNRASKFKGQREKLPTNVTWIGVDENSSRRFPVSAIQRTAVTVDVRMAHSSPGLTTMESIEVQSPAIQQYFRSDMDSVLVESQDTVRLLFVSNKNLPHDRETMIAVLNTIQREAKGVFLWREAGFSDVQDIVKEDWVIFFPDPATLRTSSLFVAKGGMIELNPRPGMQLLVRESRDRYVLTQHLNQENVVEQSLVIDLVGIFFDSNDAQETALANDLRSLDERTSWSWSEKKQQPLEAGVLVNDSSVKFIVVLLFITLLIERALAYKRDQ